MQPELREAWLQRPAKKDVATRPRFSRLRKITLVALAVVAFLATLAGLDKIGLGWVIVPALTGIQAVMVIAFCIWIAVEIIRHKRRRNNFRAAAYKQAGDMLRSVKFTDGSISDFEPSGVLRLLRGTVVAIDPKRALVRTIVAGSTPDRTTDWIFELPANTDLDVADYSLMPFKRGRGPCLIFSEEQEEGFKVNAFPLATESVEDATRLVTMLREQRQ